jgi:hypothetical protein
MLEVIVKIVFFRIKEKVRREEAGKKQMRRVRKK